jgi:hypothetical protein
MQDRCNNLLASATPLVCCGPVTCFNRHSHGGGAGNLAMVLEGIFSDEHGVHAVGINYAIPPAACTGHLPTTLAADGPGAGAAVGSEP